jgi:hypothetical protein
MGYAEEIGDENGFRLPGKEAGTPENFADSFLLLVIAIVQLDKSTLPMKLAGMVKRSQRVSLSVGFPYTFTEMLLLTKRRRENRV